MKRLIKYAALLFALILSSSIIGGCLLAGVSIARRIAEKTEVITESNGNNDENNFWYWDGDGRLVFRFGNKSVVSSVEVKSGSEQFTASEINSLDIDIGSAELIVEVWENDDIFVEYENIPVDYKFYIEDETLVIKRKDNISFVWNVSLHETPKLHVSVPAAKLFETITVDKGSGSAKLTGFLAGNVYVDNGSGGLEISKVKAEKLSLDSGSGGVNISDCRFEKSVFNSGSGSFLVKNCALGVTTMESGSGTVILEDVSAKNIRTDAGSGRVEISGVLTGMCEFESGSGSLNVLVYGREEDYNYRTDMGSGSFYLNGKKKDKDYNKEDKRAEYLLVLEAGSGRVYLDFDETKSLPWNNVTDNLPDNPQDTSSDSTQNGGSYER